MPFGRFDGTTRGINARALAIWIAVGLNAISGTALIIASLAQAIRLGRWRGAATTAEPLLWILHIGYAWLPIGLGLLAAARVETDLGAIALHALTVRAPHRPLRAAFPAAMRINACCRRGGCA